MRFWTEYLGLKAIAFFLFAGYLLWEKSEDPMSWAVIATFALTGVILLLIGLLLDVRHQNRLPQKVKVLLRHKGKGQETDKAWLLTVMRMPSGELYAPQDETLRLMEPISLRELPETVLGCPRFTPLPDGKFRILGEIYTPKRLSIWEHGVLHRDAQEMKAQEA